MCVEGSVTNITEKVSVFVVRHPAVVAPLALLALPAGANDGRDAHVGASVEVVLPAHGAEQEALELLGREVAHVAVFPVAVVIQVLGFVIN
jgi:hypothetical protein